MENLLRHFPKKNIECFVEVFAGSGIVSLNYQNPKIIFLNDKDIWLTKILKYLINNEPNLVIKKIEQIINKFNLPFNQPKEKYIEQFNLLKESFNKNKKVDKLLVLILFGFNQQIRFNSKGDFNIPAGKFHWNSYQRNKLLNYCLAIKDKKIFIKNEDFYFFVNNIKKTCKKEKTLFYFDPPYLITNATYNVGWDIEKEKQLINLLKEMTIQGYKWILSNVYTSNNKKNTFLDDLIFNTKNVTYEFINEITYKNSNYQRKHIGNDKEILIKGNL